jgi:hypothetical protein
MPTAGYNQWSAPNTGFPFGVNPTLKRLFGATPSSTPKQLATLDFSSGPPTSPSTATWALSPVPTFTDRLLFMTSDSSGNFWVVNKGSGVAADFRLQAYSISSGSQVSSTATLGTGVNQVPDMSSWVFRAGSTAFSVGGTAHLALWYGVYNSSLFTWDSVFLQIYDVSSGSPSAVASISFDLDPVGFSLALDAGVFYDGVGSLWAFAYTLDGSGQPTGGTLYKFSVPGYTQVASASFSGTYGFVGDPATGHIYLLNTDGSVSDVNPTTLVATNHPGLGASIASNPIGIAGLVGYPIQMNPITYAMLNPIYGMSTDPTTSQFFIASTGGAFPRVQNFIAVDTLVPFTDWGLGISSHSQPVWMPSEQAMVYLTSSAGPTFAWYELIYSPLSPLTLPTTVSLTAGVRIGAAQDIPIIYEYLAFPEFLERDPSTGSAWTPTGLSDTLFGAKFD